MRKRVSHPGFGPDDAPLLRPSMRYKNPGGSLPGLEVQAIHTAACQAAGLEESC